MKCPKCQKVWNETKFNGFSICPFCTTIFIYSRETKCNIINALKEMIETHGINIMQNPKFVKALLMDLAPNFVKQSKQLVFAVEQGIGNQILDCADKSIEDIRNCLTICYIQMINDMDIPEHDAYDIVNIFFQVLKLLKYHDSQSDIAAIVNGTVLSKTEVSKSCDNIDNILTMYDIIGYKAFAANSRIKELIIPSNIKIIGTKAFYQCVSLNTINIPSSIEKIGYGVFEGCIELNKIKVINNPYYLSINGLFINYEQKMLLRAENTSQTIIQIPEGIEVICTKAFEENDVERIILPESLKYIQANAFYLTQNLTDFQIENNPYFISQDGVLYDKNKSVLLKYPQGKKATGYVMEDSVAAIGASAFSWAVLLETITFSGSVKIINNNAFEYCRKLKRIVLPSNIRQIGDRAFQFCTQLKYVMLSKDLKEIRDFAFFQCSELEFINMPKEMKKIGHCAFAGCTKLKKIVLQENVIYIGKDAFLDCPELEIVIKDNSYVSTYCSVHKIHYTIIQKK